MAELRVSLSDAALAHAEECARSYGYESAAEWALDWLINSAKNYEIQKKQKEVNKLQSKINSNVEQMYGTSDSTAVPTIPSTAPKVVP